MEKCTNLDGVLTGLWNNNNSCELISILYQLPKSWDSTARLISVVLKCHCDVCVVKFNRLRYGPTGTCHFDYMVRIKKTGHGWTLGIGKTKLPSTVSLGEDVIMLGRDTLSIRGLSSLKKQSSSGLVNARWTAVVTLFWGFPIIKL